MPIKFSSDQIIERMKFENPWWEGGKIDSYYSEMKRREYFKLLFPLIQERSIKRAVVLMGPRRVGKTVLLYHTIEELIDKNVDPKDICYFSVETPIYSGISLEELLKLYFELTNRDKKSHVYIYFDEIQYLKDWELHLKLLVDSYHNAKIIVSGSAAAALKLKSRESGAGRFTEFILPPLTFHEFLILTNSEHLLNIDEKIIENELQNLKYDPPMEELNKKFIEYINYGGYPEVSLSESIKKDPGRYIRNDIIDKVLLRDLPSLYGIQDIQELNNLFTFIAYRSGDEMSLDKLSQNSGVAKNTIRKYLEYLEAAFLIRIIHRIDKNARKFKRANIFKVYLTNPSLRCALFSPLTENDSEHFGKMVETAIFSQWQHNPNASIYYARMQGGEVDLVILNKNQKPELCTEIKWSNQFATEPKKLKTLKSFCLVNNLKSALVTTKDIHAKKIVQVGTQVLEIKFEPASLYCLLIGRAMVENKSIEARYLNSEN